MGITCTHNYLCLWLCTSDIWVSRFNHNIQTPVSISLILVLLSFMCQNRNAQNAFYKVLMANAATSALRLHQRMPRLQFTREYFALLLVEDSCHYLFFSTIFLYVSPFILILMPVVLFAILHAASYSLTLLDVSALRMEENIRNSIQKFWTIVHTFSFVSFYFFQTLGQNSWWGARLMISLVELQTSNILRLAALSEILLMPLVIIFVFL